MSAETTTITDKPSSSVRRGRKPRLFFLDFIRAIAVVLILITHFNNPFMLAHPIFMYRPFGIYVGGLGVSLFLIISGAALMYTHGDADHMDLKRFYWKRFKSIYPMFWVAFIICNAYLFLRNGGLIYTDTPKWHLLFSVLGVDGIVAFTSIKTFYTLGEWFLGFIIIFYIVFPLLKWGVKKHPIVTAVVAIVLYIGSLLIPWPATLPPRNVFLLIRLPELLFGMYFIRYIKKVKWPLALVALVYLVAQELTQRITEDVATTFVGISMFLVLVFISQWLDVQPVRVPVATLAKYSYPIYLVHHQVIMQAFTFVNPNGLSVSSAYLMFGVDCLVIMFLAVGLLKLDKTVQQYVGTMFIKKEKTAAHA